MASIQLPLIVALAGKNNVLSFLTGVSHEKVSVS
jgi:ferric-chelate reductase